MNPTVMNILENNDLCVLCTCSHNIPDASLMLYICDEKCERMYMLTLKESTKYGNIAANPKVSLLVDTREQALVPETQTQALTIHGDAYILEPDTVSRGLIDQLVKKHGRLSNLASNDSVRVIEVVIREVLFLENVDKGYQLTPQA